MFCFPITWTAIFLTTDISFLATWEPSQCHIALFHSSVNTLLQLPQSSPAYRYQQHPISGIITNVTRLCSQSCRKTPKGLTQTYGNQNGFPYRLACIRLMLLFCKYSLVTSCWSSFSYFLLVTCWSLPCSVGICHLLPSSSVSASVLPTCPSIIN